jgi:hypothetical protein
VPVSKQQAFFMSTHPLNAKDRRELLNIVRFVTTLSLIAESWVAAFAEAAWRFA